MSKHVDDLRAANDEIVDLRLEVLRLKDCLSQILNCEETRCFLCPSCLAAVQPPRKNTNPPQIAADDPVRVCKAPRWGSERMVKASRVMEQGADQ